MTLRSWLFVLIYVPTCFSITFERTSVTRQGDTATYHITITPKPGEMLYADSLTLSTNHPHATLKDWHLTPSPTTRYVHEFETNKPIIDRTAQLTATLILHTDSPASLVIGHHTNQQHAPQFSFIALNDPHPTPVPATPIVQSAAVTQAPAAACSPQQPQSATLSTWAQRMFSLRTAWWLRLLLALLLGILMSLTPCVYPMIPITIGILHAHQTTTWHRRLWLALSYMAGVATMFACLGLSAAVTGTLFGSLAGKPIVVFSIVAILGYCALSLFGLYRLRLPSFLTKPHAQRPTGSIISAFLFGFVSGTIASPCLSPGLAFLLSIVAGLQAWYGFALLFMFGVGMSLPIIALAISAQALPLAGAWMLEIQKIFGILLIALCFYYLNNLVPLIVLLALMGTALLVLGFYYLISSRHATTQVARIQKLISFAALIGAGFLYYKAIQHAHHPAAECPIAWHDDYESARTQAENTHQLLFIDFGAPYCSICKAIDHCLLHHAPIAALLNRMVCVRLDASLQSTDPLSKRFAVIGVPALMVINPTTQQVLKRWGSELYNAKPDDFAHDLNVLLARFI